MKKVHILESKGKTYYLKRRGLPKGCQYCLKGQKAILFLNGICQKPNHCSFYCPLSEERKDKEVTFVDEIEISSKEELLEEIHKINAKGMSITGGEPLSVLNLEKTLNYIEYVKSNKGEKFHVHLYTNGLNFTEKIAKKLSEAGLDEIRFHPPKDKWDNIQIALNRGYSVGVEVPVIPEESDLKNLEELIIFLDKIGAEFINLNEFEMCVTNSKALKQKGFTLKEDTIASVVSSKEMALDLIKKLGTKVSIKIHFCSIIAKDYYQLKNRYLRRAKTIKLPYEVINNEGLLLFAQIYGNKDKLELFYYFLLSNIKIPKKKLILEKEYLKLPYYIVIDNNFKDLLKRFELKGNIIEITPFRNPKYQQITETTPIEVFRKEIGLYEDKER